MEKENADFLKTRVNWGLIIRVDLDTITNIKKFLADLPEVEIIYQIVDGGRLWVIRDNERRLK